MIFSHSFFVVAGIVVHDIHSRKKSLGSNRGLSQKLRFDPTLFSFADSWGQFFLKFIISHPAVTCVIPATSKPHHMSDNLGAGFGPLPTNAMRKRMAEYLRNL